MTKKLFTDHYVNQLYKLHHVKKSFGTAGKYKGLTEWFEKYQFKSCLDYGCGKASLMFNLKEQFPTCDFTGYDPGIVAFQEMPQGKFEGLICTDVLEHIEPNFLNNVLNHIESLFTRNAFLVIDTVPARKFLQDGRNAHLIIENQEWWTKKITEQMPHCSIVKNVYNEKKKKIIMELAK